MTIETCIGLHSHRRALLALVAAAGVCLATTAAADDINKRAAADPEGQVEVSNTSGSVTIQAWERNEVEVTGDLDDDGEQLEFVASGKLTRIKVVLPGKKHSDGEADLTIRVPTRSSINVNTVSADIEVQGVMGAQRLQSVSADIRTQAGTEDVECKTVSGDIDIAGQGHRALLTLTTVSGDARVRGVAGEVNANTVSGNVDLSLGDTTRSRLRSTSGDLNLQGKLVSDAKLDVESISGDVRINLQGPVAAEFDLSSFNGEIRNCFGAKATRPDEYLPGTELRFTQGAGTGRVRIKTMNGDISVCHQ